MDENLPNLVIEVIDIIGRGPAEQLVEQFGGVRVFIPRTIGRDHKIAKIIGIEPALKLSMHFGGEVLSIPKCRSMRVHTRNKEIVAAYQQGAKVNDLARSYDVTDRQIYSILSSTI